MIRGDAALWSGLRALLERAYDVDALERSTGIRPLSLAAVEQVAACRLLLDGDAARTTAVDLFMLGAGVDVEIAQRELDPVGVDLLVDAGLLEVDGAVARALVSILPFDGLWLVGDRLNERGAPDGQRVPNTDLSTVLTTNVAPRRRGRAMLDLGTGTGVHALRSAGRFQTVVGVDVNPRALTYASFNAGLNGIDSVEWVEGDFFEHLGGRRFDAIVANPPFIIAPDRDDPHRFGGGAGDALSLSVVRGAAEHLATDGMATVLCDIGLGLEDDWIGALESWVEDLGCDALCLRLATATAAGYALLYHDRKVHRSNSDFERAVRRWLDSYRSLGIECITSVAVVLRKRTLGERWIEGFDLAGNPTIAAGEHIDRMFDGIDCFRDCSLDVLGSQRLRLVDGHELVQGLHFDDGVYAPQGAQLFVAGFPLITTVRAEALPVLFGLDGSRTLDEVVAGAADTYGLCETTLRDQTLPVVRDLGMRGLVQTPSAQGRTSQRSGAPAAGS